MNNKLLISFLLLSTSLFFSCHGPVKEEKNNASANPITLHVGDEKYVTIDTKQSVATWKGANSFGSHTGYVYISKGELKLENNQLVSGTAEIDMNTLEDEKYGRNNGLIKHLKSPDFFDVKNFPTATIELTKVAIVNGENIKITGNLTIKGITRPVTFPAKITFKDGDVNINSKLIIDRTDWGIRYKSKKFLENLADQTISDSIEFDIKVVAKK
ncbi:YceI family protein [Pedobacter sp. LMG 31464]|uniref:YceI family protein n=1 Tax=Pedobacter planticolens TaxID=2679964 RepID=A0A923DVA7_9SPHI|nr:YceI family protein [Pedobacter planticolens]MBB2144574.1 YceI family protein [Pedobacter planticolens]